MFLLDKEHLPAATDPRAVIADVTMTEVSERDRSILVYIARVEKVIKGPIRNPTLKIQVMGSSCGPGVVEMGTRGFVVGTFEQDTLMPMYLTYNEGAALSAAASKKWNWFTGRSDRQ